MLGERCSPTDIFGGASAPPAPPPLYLGVSIIFSELISRNNREGEGIYMKKGVVRTVQLWFVWVTTRISPGWNGLHTLSILVTINRCVITDALCEHEGNRYIYPGQLLKSFNYSHIRSDSFKYIYTESKPYCMQNGFWQTYNLTGFPANSIQPATSATRLLQCLSPCFPFSSSTGWSSRFVRHIWTALGNKTCSKRAACRWWNAMRIHWQKGYINFLYSVPGYACKF